ncbi:hypothetical protein RI367_003184 [Sorochytrium milnesiophthora]
MEKDREQLQQTPHRASSSRNVIQGSPCTRAPLGTATPITEDDVPSVSVPRLLMLEWTAATLTAAAVSPFISIVDKAIIANASGAQKLGDCLREGFSMLFRRPLTFARQPSFLLVWIVYTGTYITANTIESMYTHYNKPWALPKFLGTSAANISLMLWKDRAFTRWFGTTQPRPVPLPSFALFAARDAMTMGASFTLPNTVSQQLRQASPGVSKGQADFLAQLLLPCAMQVVSTPMHLTALDLYNRPNCTAPQRYAFVRQQYFAALGARIGRILPAYGVGGNLNRALRTQLKSQFL